MDRDGHHTLLLIPFHGLLNARRDHQVRLYLKFTKLFRDEICTTDFHQQFVLPNAGLSTAQ